jgi:hypothetical protein
MVGEAIKMEDQCLNYRTIIVVNGNGPPASRLVWLLRHCDVVILLEESDLKEFYSFGLLPFVH